MLLAHNAKKGSDRPWPPPKGPTVRGKTASGHEFTVNSDLISRVRGVRQESVETDVFGTDSTVNFATFRLRSDSTAYFANCPTVRSKIVSCRYISSTSWRSRHMKRLLSGPSGRLSPPKESLACQGGPKGEGGGLGAGALAYAPGLVLQPPPWAHQGCFGQQASCTAERQPQGCRLQAGGD